MAGEGTYFRSVLFSIALLGAAGAAAGEETEMPRGVRVTGTIRAVSQYVVLVPRIEGQSAMMTLTWLAPNSSRVEKGDVVAEFDRTAQLDQAREALAKFEDLEHQVKQRQAENRANAEKRAEEMAQAEAELAKAEVQLGAAEVMAEIERLQTEVRAEDARAHVASLKVSHADHEAADAAALRLVELQMERQRLALERAERNAEALMIRAPLAGMVAHEYVYRSGTQGRPQVGDQLYRGYPLLRIFDPSEMEVYARVDEPDGAALVVGAPAVVILDAYPDLRFPARLAAASPVASSALIGPIKRFNTRFILEEQDSHLLPDLSAAVVILDQGGE